MGGPGNVVRNGGAEWRLAEALSGGRTSGTAMLPNISMTGNEFKTALGNLRRSIFSFDGFQTVIGGLASRNIVLTALALPLYGTNEGSFIETMQLLLDAATPADVDYARVARPLLKLVDDVKTIGPDSINAQYGYQVKPMQFQGKSATAVTLEGLLGVNP